MNRLDSLKRAFSHIRYWWYRRSIGRPISLMASAHEFANRYKFERGNGKQRQGEGNET